MINLLTNPSERYIELGGGDNPHPACQVNVDVRSGPRVHFTVDFNSSDWPINSEEWDGVYSHFLIEHISWRNTAQFLKEVFRIIKPGGKAVFALPNTEAQMRKCLRQPDWEDEESRIIFGDLDYPENSHRASFNPRRAVQLFQEAGFTKVLSLPYGELRTDLCIVATKPTLEDARKQAMNRCVDLGGQIVADEEETKGTIIPSAQLTAVPPLPESPNRAGLSSQERAALFDHAFFDSGRGKVGGYYPPGYRDFPCNENRARFILSRRPKSVVEIGCGRGYVLKRIQDAGIFAVGFDISEHCYLTRVAQGISLCDFHSIPSGHEGVHDLCCSYSVLDRVPEELLSNLIQGITQVSSRGLHYVDTEVRDGGYDKTLCTVRPLSWWKERLPSSHEVYDRIDVEMAALPEDYVRGDGKVKLNIGSFTTMFHHGWTNVDVHDLGTFAAQQRYHYLRADARAGLPFATGTVDLIYSSHMLEHLTYAEGRTFLRECRRVLKPTGAMRIIVPDAESLTEIYANMPDELEKFDEVNEGCRLARTPSEKLYALLYEGHAATYDAHSLQEVLAAAGFRALFPGFRESRSRSEASQQILRETLDVLPCLSLYAEALPILP